MAGTDSIDLRDTSAWTRARYSPLTLFTDMLVYGVVIPCLPILVIDRLEGDSTMVGFLFGCYDRYQNRRYPMMGGMLGLVISTLAFAMADTYALLVLARVAQGVAGCASWSGIGGALYEYGGMEAPFFFCAGFAVLNFLAILWLAEPKHNHIEETQVICNRASTDKKSLTMIDLLKNWRILSCVLCVTVSASVFAGIEPALPIHLQQTFNASASTSGFIFVAMVVPAFLAPLIGHLSDKIGRQAISATGMIMMAIASPLVALQYTSIYWIIPPLMVFGLSSPVTLTPVLPEMGETVNEMGGAAYAQVYALYNMAYSIGMFIGPVVAGLIMSAADFETLMIVFGASLIICSPIMMNWGAVYRRTVAFFRRN
ncbi:major facilitator superfamily domain-containing protein [Mucor lusitanicus]